MDILGSSHDVTSGDATLSRGVSGGRSRALSNAGDVDTSPKSPKRGATSRKPSDINHDDSVKGKVPARYLVTEESLIHMEVCTCVCGRAQLGGAHSQTVVRTRSARSLCAKFCYSSLISDWTSV